MNQLEFKYMLLTQLANYNKLEELLKNNNKDEAVKEIATYKEIIMETLNKN